MAAGVRQPRGEATRADIINVARRLFSEHGYHHTGIADIQAATGLTKGAFYHHFLTKEDLALAVLEAARADYASRLVEPAMKGNSPGERLVALLDGVVALNARPEWLNCRMMATLCAELTAGGGRLTGTVQAMYGAFVRMWQRAIAEAQAAGQASNEVPAEVWAEWIMATLFGVLTVRKLGAGRVEPAVIVDQIKRSLLKTDEPAERLHPGRGRPEAGVGASVRPGEQAGGG